MEHKFPNVQFILDAHAGSLVVLTAEGHSLPEDDHFGSLTTCTWAVVGPIVSICLQIFLKSPTSTFLQDTKLRLRKTYVFA